MVPQSLFGIAVIRCSEESCKKKQMCVEEESCVVEGQGVALILSVSRGLY